MQHLYIKTAAEQVADHLRQEIRERSRIGKLPGGIRLSKELGVGRMTVEDALRILENEGLVCPKGKGRCREILLPDDHVTAGYTMKILLFDEDERKRGLYLDLLHRLIEKGIRASFADQTLRDLHFSGDRVGKYVRKVAADAWIVIAGNREVLESVSRYSSTVFALFGYMAGLPVAGTGPSKRMALKEAVGRLVGLGHRRIVALERNRPEGAELEGHWLREALLEHGILMGAYNLPVWEDTAVGLGTCLDSLFRVTPPTAILADSPITYFGVLSHLAARGIRIPKDVSMVSTDPCVEFQFIAPSVAHISFDGEAWVRRIVEWAGTVASGKRDERQSLSETRFIDGGSVGPVPSRRVGNKRVHS